MFRGNDFSFTVALAVDNVPLNISGGVLRMTAKWLPTDADASEVFSVYSPSNGITITDAVNGKATVVVASSLTSSLPYATFPLYYDLQLTDTGNNKFTVLNGILTVRPNITRTSP